MRQLDILFLILIFCCFECRPSSNQNKDRWSEAKIDDQISYDSVYKLLDKQNEIFSALENHDSLMKRTSDVAYFSGEIANLNNFDYCKLNNCRSYFLRSDTLIINIGIGNGFGGHGFIIQY